ncbi:TonB-dependent siderophore receptor [Oxalicibacterium flavum]|uniref:TonB-dependent siderophore receptor n=1 Tax=Oxalicibacterium flavum TaxID=179467 RepID=UPI001665D39C|nr:TonB-dependent receptor [Oxalicibacterium flavum]
MFLRISSSARVAPLPRKPLALAVGQACMVFACMAILPSHAPAAEPVQASAQSRQYNIAAGPLQSALSRFAAEAQVTVSFVPALVADKHTGGLQGNYQTASGLRQLLIGTGLEAVAQGEGIFVLQAQAASATSADDAVLPAVTITGQVMRDGTSEGTGSYQARFTNTATKLTLSPRETPQTITTITRQQLDDAGMTSLDDALKSVSGVFSQEQGSAGGTYTSRGFGLQAQVDGMSTPSGVDSGNRSVKFDNAFVDRIEVLQGAAGLMTGAGNPGGTVNMVRKRPTDTFQAQAEMQLGSWNARRFVGDVSSPLVESGRVRGRVVALDDRSDSFTDYIFRNRSAVYGIVEADLSPSTTLSASVQYQKDTGLNHFGVPFAADGSDAGLPRSSFWGDANYRLARDYTIYTIGLDQRLTGDWNLKASYSRQKTLNEIDNFNALTGSLDIATGDGLSISTRSRNNSTTMRADTVDAYASGPFNLLGRKHELVLGLNGATYEDESTGTGYIAGSIPINVYDFDPGALGEVANGTASRSGTKTTNIGLYTVARWNLTDSLKLITGARISNYESKNAVTGLTTLKETGEITPYAGLVYDIDDQYSAYVSYSDIFNPQSRKSADGSVLDPVVGANVEAGIKGELLDKRLNVSAAVFQLEQSNLSVRDDSVPVDAGNACGGTCYIAAGKVVSQGLDLGINGQASANLNIAAGYTYVSAEYKAGPQKGQRYGVEQPRHSLRLAANYKLPETSWSVGGNVTATNKIHRSASNNAWTIRQGGLVLIGLNARYQISPKTQMLLAVSNLTDRSYRHLYSLNYSPYGEPRKLSVNLKHTF